MDFKLTINLGDATLSVLSQLVQSLNGLTTQHATLIEGTHAGNAAPSAVAAAASPTVPAVPAAGVPLPPSAAPSPAPALALEQDAEPAATGPAPDVDAAGLPWDGRIHSESKATVADGTWRKRRNTPPELVTQVEAELRGLLAGNAAPGVASTTPAPPASVAPTPPAEPPAAPVPPAPAAINSAASASDTFEAFFKPYVAAMQGGKINSQMVNDALQQIGIPTVMVLKQRPELIASFKALLGVD